MFEIKFFLKIVFLFFLLTFAACIAKIDVKIYDKNQAVSVTQNCKIKLSLLDTISNTTGSHGQAAFVLGNLGLASTDSGTEVLQLVDLSDKNNLVNRGSYDPSGHSFYDLYAENNIVYGGTGSGQLRSIDISDPDNPVTIDTLSIPGENWGVLGHGNFLYVGNYTSGLNIINKSDPSNLSITSTIPGYGLSHMIIEGSTLYGTTHRKIVIMNISSPSSPTLIGELDLGANFLAYEIHKAGNYIYALGKVTEEIRTIDISTPSTPTLVYTSATGVGNGNDLRSIVGTNDKIFIGTGSNETGEILAFDIKKNPIIPELEDRIFASNRTYEIFLKDNYIFTANRSGKSDLITFTCE